MIRHTRCALSEKREMKAARAALFLENTLIRLKREYICIVIYNV